MKPISVDYETFFSSKLKYSLTTMIPEQYCAHSLFDPYLISVSDGADTWAGEPKDFNWQALEGRDLLSHNARFDKTVYEEMVRRGSAPRLNIPSWQCTANLTAYMCNRRSLDQAIEHLFKIKVSKATRAEANNRRWVEYSKEDREAMLQYARGDAKHCWDIWDKYGGAWPENERKLSDITIKQGMHGVQIDRALLDNYIIWSHEMRANTETLIPWIADAADEEWEDFVTKPTSTKCIAEQCRRSGIPCPPTKSDDEEGYELWAETYRKHHQWIDALGSWRSINKLYKTFLVVKERLRSDGTLPFGLKYFGAHTGRWAGESRVNFQNMRKKPVICNEYGLMETDDKRIDAAIAHKHAAGQWPEWCKYIIDFRNLVIPRPGKKMIASDLAQIEPRVLNWLAGNFDLLKSLEGGMSIYEAHARSSMNWTGGNLKKGDAGIYALAKARVLALGFQAGWEKFVTMAQTLAGLDITIGDPEFVEDVNPFTGQKKQISGYGFNSKRIVKEFRDSNPKIVGLWQTLENAMRSSVGSDLVLTLPSGRKMTYEFVRGESRIEPDKENPGKVKKRTVYTAGIGGKRTLFYGGKLAENITQATAREIFGEHIVNMDRNGWWNLFSVHDEAVLEVDQSVTAKDVEHEMSKCPEWIAGCPIAAEASELACYTK